MPHTTPSRLSKRLRHAGVCIDTHRNTSIGSRSLARAYVYLERRFGGRGGGGRSEDSDDCSTKTAMTIAQSSTEQLKAAHSSSQQHTAAHSSSQQLTAAHSSSQQHTAAHSSTQHANPLAQQASSLRPTGLDSIPCVPVTRSERRRVHFSVGEPGFCGGRRAVCLALYLHVYTYVYHTCIFTCIHICISRMHIYMYTHMYITHVYLHT